MTTEMMKAVFCTQYGPPEVLQIREVPKPVPKSNQVLLKVMATAVNSGDVRVRGLAVQGFLKIVMRFVLGFTKPRKPILGVVFAGVVEQVGSDVQAYKVGDKLFGITGFQFGAYAEYMLLSEKTIAAKMPSNATFEEAAALPFGGHTAIDLLQKTKIAERSNPKVLVYGATGAVGTSAVQIAKHYNATITAVCSSNGKSLVEQLGVDDIILYDKEDFTQTTNKYDIVFDAVGKVTKQQCSSLLAQGGSFVTVGGLSVVTERKEQLELLRTLFEQDKYLATIDKVFTLYQIVEANRYVDTGRKKGNVVIRVFPQQ